MSVTPVISTATFEESKGIVLAQFAALVSAAANDAAAIFHLVYSIDDGNYYGRYFTAPTPLPSYVGSNDSVRDLIAQGAQLVTTVDEAIATAVAEVSDSFQFPRAVVNLVGSLRRACANPADAIRILSDLAGFETRVGGGETDAIGAEITALSQSAARVMRRAAGISLALASADYIPTSQADAFSVRNAIADILENLSLEAGDLFEDRMKAQLDALQICIITDLTARGASLAPMVQKKFNVRLPAAVVAYRLYQDADRAVDLLTRNDPPHPAFMPTAIEALAF